ncbi:MAG TPA: hypothetical protein VF074_03250 [Pyrinomonadaceae bacterium]
MYPHSLKHNFFCVVLSITSVLFLTPQVGAKQKPPRGGWIAVVVDERLSALRSTPDLSGKLIHRLGRGRLVAVRGVRKKSDGLVFFHVNVSSRTRGWIQREAVVSPFRAGDDDRLLHLILSSTDFDRIARARIFLDHFPRSRLRPQVLLQFGDTVEELAGRLTREAARRIDSMRLSAAAPEFSYYLNYSGLDRYNRQGVRFVFDSTAKQFHYDGAAYRELIRRYPGSPEATVARRWLAATDIENYVK